MYLIGKIARRDNEGARTHLVYNLKVAGSRSSTVSTIDVRPLSLSNVPSGYAYAGINSRGISLGWAQLSTRFVAGKIRGNREGKDGAICVSPGNRSDYLTMRGGRSKGREAQPVTCLGAGCCATYQSSLRDAPDYYFNLVGLTSGPSFIPRAFFLLLHQLPARRHDKRRFNTAAFLIR